MVNKFQLPFDPSRVKDLGTESNGQAAGWTETSVDFMHTSPGDFGISVCVHDHPASGGVSRDSLPPPCPAEPCLPDTVPWQTTSATCCEWLCAPGW